MARRAIRACAGCVRGVARLRKPILGCRGAMNDSFSDVAVSSIAALGDADASRNAAGDLGFLWDFWYPALRSAEIRGRGLVTAMLLEVPLVLGRADDGRAFAMRDACPHRGIPLSYGRFDGQVLECGYHGWKFEAC